MAKIFIMRCDILGGGNRHYNNYRWVDDLIYIAIVDDLKSAHSDLIVFR